MGTTETTNKKRGTVMNDSDFILKWTEDLKQEIDVISYQEDDIRKDYFGLTYDVAYCFYRGFILMDISKYIDSGQVLFKKDIFDFKTHVDSIVELNRIALLNTGYYNGLIRNFMIDCWSVFELCVTTLCEGICSLEERENLLNFQSKDVLKQLKKSTLDENDRVKLIARLKKAHLTHVPITRKTAFLFNKTKGYSRNLDNDKAFLSFLGKFRNTLHTNFIYYGNDYDFNFGNANFKFENTKMVKWTDPFSKSKRSPKLYFYIIGQLKEIWKEVIKTVKHDATIYYPDNEQT